MNPLALARARAGAPAVLAALAELGLLANVVEARGGAVLVRSRHHEEPVVLVDVDDAQWYALEAGAW